MIGKQLHEGKGKIAYSQKKDNFSSNGSGIELVEEIEPAAHLDKRKDIVDQHRI